MNRIYGVGAVSYGLSNMCAVGRVVSALLMSLVALGMVSLAILTLFIPRRCSELGERVLTWLSIWLKRLARKVATKRWEWLGDGLVLVVGLGPGVNGWHQVRVEVGAKECLSMDISVPIWLSMGPFFVSVMRGRLRTSQRRQKTVDQSEFGGY